MTDDEAEARRLVSELPIPLDLNSALGRQRRQLDGRVAELAAARGAPDELEALLHADYEAGGSIVPWLRHLVERGHCAEVALRARIRARMAEHLAEDRAALEALSREAANTGGAWVDALAVFAVQPSTETWEDFMRFCPSDLRFERTQQAVVWLREAGVDADAVYLALAPMGVTSELIGLVEDGLVNPAIVEENLDLFVSAIARGTMLVSAARGAAARNESAECRRLAQSARRTGMPEDLLAIEARGLFDD